MFTKHLICACTMTAAFALAPSAHGVGITGAGSSAAAPLYNIWASSYTKTNGVAPAYQSVGSSAGIKQIKAKSVDFGASDVALSSADLKKDKLIQFPSAISGVVPVINLTNLGDENLRLTGPLLARIFSRQITRWDDPSISALNPKLKLPKKEIAVIARIDGSGTNYNFTDYLSKVDPNWKAQYGRDFITKWPAGVAQFKGSGGVVEALKATPYSITYVDFNYVIKDKLEYALVQNKEGKFPQPSEVSFSSALKKSRWISEALFEETLTDQAGDEAWPITMGTFVIMPQVTTSPEKTSAALEFFTWSFLHGDHAVGKVSLVRLPDRIQALAFRAMTTVVDTYGNPLSWMIR